MAGALSLKAEAISRGARMLRTALGPAIATWLEDPSVVEVMLNPDGYLWVDRLTEGLADTGERLSVADGERIVRLVAHPQRRNVLVAGGTSTGKTTLVNALLAEVAKTSDRVVLIEDTRELQCRARNLVALRTKDGVASLSDLVRSSLRLRPDRIPAASPDTTLKSSLTSGNARDGRLGSVDANVGLACAHANVCGARLRDHVNRVRADDAHRGDAYGYE
jgi:Flp pilus assembly CpaF family ATPase